MPCSCDCFESYLSLRIEYRTASQGLQHQHMICRKNPCSVEFGPFSQLCVVAFYTWPKAGNESTIDNMKVDLTANQAKHLDPHGGLVLRNAVPESATQLHKQL